MNDTLYSQIESLEDGQQIEVDAVSQDGDEKTFELSVGTDARAKNVEHAEHGSGTLQNYLQDESVATLQFHNVDQHKVTELTVLSDE